MLTKINSGSRRYFKVSDGAFIENRKDGRQERFCDVSGQLTGIALKEHRQGSQTFSLWHLTMEDAGDIYDISFSRKSATFKSIVRFLVSDNGLSNLGDIKIKLYQSANGYTNACLWGGGQKLDWSPEAMPPVTVAMVGGREHRDDGDRMRWIGSLVDRINAKLSNPSCSVSDTGETEYEDNPEVIW